VNCSLWIRNPEIDDAVDRAPGTAPFQVRPWSRLRRSFGNACVRLLARHILMGVAVLLFLAFWLKTIDPGAVGSILTSPNRPVISHDSAESARIDAAADRILYELDAQSDRPPGRRGNR
jgi:hypothetical protein